jgi:hypothetical protein
LSERCPDLCKNEDPTISDLRVSLKLKWADALAKFHKQSDENKFLDAWGCLVSDYNSRTLTFGSDKLVAIASLVDLTKRAQGTRNIAAFRTFDFLK